MLQQRAETEKHAFLVMYPGLDPANYHLDFTGKDLTTFVGVGDLDQAEAMVRSFAAEGRSVFNLCGAFDQSSAERLAKAAGPGTSFSYVTFEGDEIRKRQQADITGGVGFIVYDSGVGQIQPFKLQGTLPASVRFVDSLVMARAAARDLIREGYPVIELCSWFDAERTETLIHMVGSEVPIGSAGYHTVTG